MKTFNSLILILGLALPVSAQYYSGGKKVIHGHTSNTDGGALTNIVFTGSATITNGAVVRGAVATPSTAQNSLVNVAVSSNNVYALSVSTPGATAGNYVFSVSTAGAIAPSSLKLPDGNYLNSYPNDCSKSAVFTGNGNFVVPQGVSLVWITGCGGGGGGASNGGGGAAGNQVINFPISVTPGETIAVTIGGGGGSGAAGGNTTFGSYISIPGGGPGVVSANGFSTSVNCSSGTIVCSGTSCGNPGLGLFCGANGGRNTYPGLSQGLFSGGAGSTSGGGGGAGLFGPGAAGVPSGVGGSAGANTCAGAGGSNGGGGGTGGSGKLIVTYVSTN